MKSVRYIGAAAALAIAGALIVTACSSPLSAALSPTGTHETTIGFRPTSAARSVSASTAPSTSVTLNWGAATGASPAGYKVYVGTAPGSYSQSIDVGNASTYVLGGLDPTKVYYISTTAYDSSGAQSAHSNEVTNVSAAKELTISGVGESGDDGDVAQNTLDGDLATRWSANGDGQWIGYDLGAVKTVRMVNVAVYHGDSRQQSFDVYISTDNSTWTKVASAESSGTTTGLENFPIPPSQARYVVLLGHGNTVNTWNSLTEVQILGW